MKTLNVTTLYGHSTQEPRVALTLDELTIQLSSEEARSVATSLVEASFAADADAFVYDFAREIFDANPAEAAVMLGGFREWRKKRAALLASVQDADTGDPTTHAEVNGG